MNWQLFCDWFWAPIIAPCVTYGVGKLLSFSKIGRRILRKLTLGSPKIAIIADDTEQHNISKSLTSTGVFKDKNIKCKTYSDTDSRSFNSRFDAVIIVFDYKADSSKPGSEHPTSEQEKAEDKPEQEKAEDKLKKFLASFKTTDEPLIIFAKNIMNPNLFKEIADRANTSICQARGRLTADVLAQLSAFNG